MTSIIICTLIGNLGKAPEVKPNNVVRFSVATSQYNGKDAQGNSQYKSVWWDCVCFGKVAEKAQKDLDKGTRVYLEAEPEQDEYTDKDNVLRRKIQLRVTRIITLQRDKNSSDVQSTTNENKTQQTQETDKINDSMPLPPIVERHRDLFGEPEEGTGDLPF